MTLHPYIEDKCPEVGLLGQIVGASVVLTDKAKWSSLGPIATPTHPASPVFAQSVAHGRYVLSICCKNVFLQAK